MSKKYLILIENINNELEEINATVQRAKRAWTLALEKDEPLYLDSVALSLHDFYNGLERLFERIAESVDEYKPDGINWHREILNQMSLEVPNVRPAIISQSLKEKLDEYRAFRHIVRNVYAHNLRLNRMKNLIEKLDTAFKEVKESLQSFCKFLNSVK